MDAVGGYYAFVQSRKLEKEIRRTGEARFSDVAHNKNSLIGRNVYADLSAPLIKEEGPLHIPYRLAEPYENLRAYLEKDQPNAVLLTFGELEDSKQRADTDKGYLA